MLKNPLLGVVDSCLTEDGVGYEHQEYFKIFKLINLLNKLHHMKNPLLGCLRIAVAMVRL
jgi:hypothetical protein